jgi:hypothetical protein
MAALRGGLMHVGVVAREWSKVLTDAAQEVFGCGSGRPRLFGGRTAKRWFQQCKDEYAALQAALRQQDSHAAREARRAFVNKKRRVQRQLARSAQQGFLQDVKHNPRRFWTAYKKGPPPPSFHDMDALSAHWQDLYAVRGCGGLQEAADCVADLVQGIESRREGPAPAGGESLSDPIDIAEVEAAVRKLGLGRMVGPDLVRGEYLRGLYREEMVLDSEGLMRIKHVYDTQPGDVLHDLCALLNAAFRSSDVPVDWCATYLSAVFKKGDPSLLDNYRGIAVGSAVGKVFSLVLHRRLSEWSEANGCRARGQAGFRDGHRTCDHVFVLKHLIDRARIPGSRGGKLFTCFVDFRKAYDLVHRDLLLQCLADLGVSGHMLGALASMYWHAPMTVKNGATLGASFDSTRGVKQGDPLSPLLFGLFIDKLEQWMSDRLGDLGIELGGEKLRLLLYADDLTLLATSAEDLQMLLDCLQGFCDHYRMHVNVAKCAVVVFGKRRPTGGDLPQGGWLYAGQQVPRVAEFRYLGIVFHETKGVSACVEALRLAGLRAMWGMLNRCSDMEVASLEVQVQLFDSLVSPVLGFCAEVWAPTLLRGAQQPHDCLNNPLQRVQTLFMRRLGGGLRKSTSRHLMLREFGCRPLVRGWLQAAVGLWNRIQQLPAEHLLRVTVAESLALGGNVGSSWVSDFTAVLNAFGALPENGLFDDGVPCPLPAHSVLSSFDRWLYGCWCDLPSDPRSAPSNQVSYCKYQQWFAVEGGSEVDPLHCLDRGRWSDCPDYVRHTAPMSRESVRALASFRLGAHDLDVVTAKFQSRSAVGNAAGTARAARLCRFCHQGVGDEMHMLVECEAYDAVRRSHADLFGDLGGWTEFPRSVSADEFRAFMHQPAHQVSAFLRECGQRRWANPPLEVLFADGLSAEEADALMRADTSGDAMPPEASDLFHSALSDEYYDVYSDAYYDTDAP